MKLKPFVLLTLTVFPLFALAGGGINALNGLAWTLFFIVFTILASLTMIIMTLTKKSLIALVISIVNLGISMVWSSMIHPGYDEAAIIYSYFWISIITLCINLARRKIIRFWHAGVILLMSFIGALIENLFWVDINSDLWYKNDTNLLALVFALCILYGFTKLNNSKPDSLE